MVKKMQLADKQMDHFTREDLEKLLADRSGVCVSLLMPVERRGIETKGNPIRLRNLIDRAESRLERMGLKNGDARELLTPARALLEDTWFWQHQSSGLALFAAAGEFYTWRLPLSFEETAEVSRQFVVRPLTPLLTGDGPFHVLALAKGGVRLLECVRYTFGERELPRVPTSLPEQMRYDIFDISAQNHTAAVEGSGAVGMWHGHGSLSDAAALKEYVREFCRHLDTGVCDVLADRRSPLVLAGVEFMRAFYRDVSHYPIILEEGINASPDQMRDEELHRRAWEIVEPIFAKSRQEALELYQQRSGSHDGRTGNTLEQIVPAALFKRVDTLFVTRGARAWGRFDRDSGEVTLHPDWEPGDQDLVDLAVAHTLRNHGTVYELPTEPVPGRGPLAALFRY